MARKLPWSARSEPGASSTILVRNSASNGSRPASTKDRRKTANASVSRTSAPALATPRKRVASRTPSTSPPPGPPTTEPMIDGYDGDDIYIMVEDEFQTTAQSFTAHLHHAEYKRLVKRAKEGPRKSLSEPDSPVSAETKQRLRKAALQQKQKRLLRDITNPFSTLVAEAEEEKVDDPWAGTSLAGLMATSSQQKTSLVGLENLAGTSRAAQGFARHEPQNRGKNKTILEEFGSARVIRGVSSHEPVVSGRSGHQRDDIDSSGTDVTLEPSIERFTGRETHKTVDDAVSYTLTEKEGRGTDRGDVPSSKKTHPKPSPNTANGDLVQEHEHKPDKEDSRKQGFGVNKLAEKRKLVQEEERKKRARLDEIPMFVL